MGLGKEGARRESAGGATEDRSRYPTSGAADRYRGT